MPACVRVTLAPEIGTERMQSAGEQTHSGPVRRAVNIAVWFLALILLWRGFVVLDHVSNLILPAPSSFLLRIVTSAHAIFPQALSTTELVIIGFIAGAAPAVPLGFLIATSPLMQRTLYPFLVFLNVIPKIALVPLLLVWFGFGGLPKVIVAALLVFFPVMVDTISGLQSADPRLLYISRSMGATRLQTIWYLRLPLALPYIFSGMKIAIVLAVTVVVVAEFVGSNDGLGYLILRAISNHDMSLSFAALFVAALIGLVLSSAVGLIERLTLPS